MRSILGQTLQDLELILCDNASTDDSAAICRRLAAEDRRVRYHRHDFNIGANRNYQAVLDRATGKYFKWASSSDLCASSLLAECVALLESQPDAVLATGRTVLFTQTMEDGSICDDDFALLSDDGKDRYATLLTSMKLNNAFNGVMRTAALKTIAPLGTFEGADTAMMAELALRGKFLLLDKPLIYRRMSLQTATKLQSVQEKHQHMEPTAKQPLLWQAWQFHLNLLRGAMRSAPWGRAWVRTVGYALRKFVWARYDLVGDVRQAIRRIF